MKALTKFIWTNLGNCPKCTGTAFQVAVIAILITIGGSFFLPKSAVLLMCLGAAGLSALWATHVIVFSLKTLSRRDKSSQVEPSMASRRKLFGTFANIAAVAALSSAVPSVALAGHHKSPKRRVQCCAGCYSSTSDCSVCDSACLKKK